MKLAALLAALSLCACAAHHPLTAAPDIPHVPPAGYLRGTPDIAVTLKLLGDESFKSAWFACGGAQNVNQIDSVIAFTCFTPEYIAVRKSQCETAQQMTTGFCWELANVAGWNDGN